MTFNICKFIKHQSDLKSVSMVNYTIEVDPKVFIEQFLGVERLAAMILNFDGGGIGELVGELDGVNFARHQQ